MTEALNNKYDAFKESETNTTAFSNKPKKSKQAGHQNNSDSVTSRTTTILSEEEWMVQKGVQMRERQLRVEQVCLDKQESTGMNVHWETSPKQFIVDVEHRLAYCWQAKV